VNKAVFVLPPFRKGKRESLPEETYFWNAQWARRNRTMGWDLRGVLRAGQQGPVTFDQPEVPLGVIHLASYPSQAGWSVEILDLWDAGSRDIDTEWVRARARAYPAQVYLFSCFTNNYVSARTCMRAIRETHPAALFVIGGAHVTGWPDEALRDGFDLVVVGEGEAALLALAEHDFDRQIWHEVPGARFLGDEGRIVCSDRRTRGVDLPDPLPAYHLLPERYRQSYYARLFTAHGCPFRCTFCSDVLWTGMKPRIKPGARISAELDALEKYVSFNELYVSDETFTVRGDHALASARLLHERGIVWGCETRADLVDHALLAGLAEYGCVEIDFGIESLAESVLRLAKKKIYEDRVRQALWETSRVGIRTHVNLMVGLPGETRETARTTIAQVCQWLEEGIVSTVDYFVTVPYPGSELFDHGDRFGLRLRTRDWSLYREDDLPVYDLPTLDAEEIFGLWREGLERLADAMVGSVANA